MQIANLLPIEVIFNLLSVCRRTGSCSLAGLRLALQQRKLHSLVGPPAIRQPWSRLAFWLRLCKAAGLVEYTAGPSPTMLVEEWMAWSFQDQLACLIDAWQKAPEHPTSQSTRTNLLLHLQENIQLGISHRRELVGLQILGVCEGERLSPLGQALLNGQDRAALSTPAPGLWNIAGEHLVVPFPPDWSLAWELEKYLDQVTSTPTEACALYSLQPAALRLAVQRGALLANPTLTDVLRRGLGAPPPDLLLSYLADAPGIRLVQGFVLEFSHPGDLKDLRRLPGLRRELDRLLSPHHVALDPWRGWSTLQRLYRRGLLSDQDLATAKALAGPSSPRVAGFTRSEQAYLLSLVLLAENISNVIAPPPGLAGKLAASLEAPLRAAAARKASRALAHISPLPAWQPENTPPPPPDESLVQSLQEAIDLQESIDILYQASGRHAPEYRHITPLLIENRGERSYLLAYCHQRRSNRTFRLDRLKLCIE
ncbi:MAG TPA: WYL domain-containing protein [Anaerolineales bacterium]|nr:WYL domain-containing protein [Anaerolineales bacterium]